MSAATPRGPTPPTSDEAGPGARWYRVLFESSVDAVLVVRHDGRIEDANPAACRMHGFTVEELRALGRAGVVVLDDRYTAAAEERRRSGRCSAEYRHRRKDGSTFPVQVESVIVDPDRPDWTAFVIARDLTGRRRTEEALRESEARFRLALRNAPVSVAAQDRELRYFWAYGQKTAPAGGIVGLRDEDLFTPEEVARITAIKRRVLGEGVDLREQMWLERPSGRIYLDICWEPIRDASGQVVGVASATVDLTPMKLAEDALRVSEQKFAAIHDHAPLAISLTRLSDGTLVEVNDEWVRMFGHPRAAAIGSSSEALGLVTDREGRRRLYAALERGEGPLSWETPYLTAAGERRWFLGVATAVEIGGERLLLTTAQDITDRRRVEEELRVADQRKADFLAVLSHELRNPLAPIRNSVELLERAPADAAQALRAKAIIRRQTEHLTRLVDDLLDVTRISHGKIALQRRALDLREVIRKTADDLGSVFEAAGVRLEVDLPPQTVGVDADPTRIAQVLGNLLHNAVKFTPGGGRVVVAAATEGGWAELRVRDSGAGIEPEMLGRLFEPFAQADRTLARTQGGLGLGLALVKGLVELHGGSVSARSDGAGHGAELRVRLPLAPEAEVPAPERAVDPPGRRPRTVVVIEDHLDAGQSLLDLLCLEGHDVHLARDGRSGLALVRAIRPDAVLCDLGLPDLSGFEVAQALRREPALGALRLIALSGYVQPEDRERAREAGFDAHVAKPPDLDALLEAMDPG